MMNSAASAITTNTPADVQSVIHHTTSSNVMPAATMTAASRAIHSDAPSFVLMCTIMFRVYFT